MLNKLVCILCVRNHVKLYWEWDNFVGNGVGNRIPCRELNTLLGRGELVGKRISLLGIGCVCWQSDIFVGNVRPCWERENQLGKGELIGNKGIFVGIISTEIRPEAMS